MQSLAVGLKQKDETAALHRLQDLLPHDIIGTHSHCEICVPDWAFRPDHWTVTFLRGLAKVRHDLAFASVWEVGVGTGVNLIALSNLVSGASWYFSDYNPDCTSLAASNLQAAGVHGSYTPLWGRRNLVHADVGQVVPKVDVVFGCLPQVPEAHGIDRDDRVAHYYDPRMFPCSSRHACGLALNEALLMGATRVLNPKGRVILNLSGRPGRERLDCMFNECGYAARVLHEAIVPQHAATSLNSLVAIESESSTRQAFEFFADPEAHVPLCAGRAEARRQKGQPVYHKIFVIEGTLQ